MKFSCLFLLISSFLLINSSSAKKNLHRTSRESQRFLCPANNTSDEMNCEIEVGDFRTDKEAIAPEKLTVIEYNIDRNGYGGDSPDEQGLQNIISLMNGSNSSLPTPDVLIMSELARDCLGYKDYVNGPLELAKQLGMFYAYVVEYVEFENVTGHQCTIGNGLFSKYELLNIGQLRFVHQCCKFSERAGGRIAVFADILLSNDRIVTFYSTHLESGQSTLIDIIDSLVVRVEQISELIDHANINNSNSSNIVISGDFNAPFGDIDSVNIKLQLNDYTDSHSALDYFDRDTCPFDSLSNYDIFVFDYIWTTGKRFHYYNPVICNLEYSKPCYGASDHLPIMVTIGFDDQE